MTLELKFMKWASGWWSSPVLDHALPWLTYLGSHYAFILFIILSWIITKQRKVLRYLVLLYAIQSTVIYSLKFLIQRQRPFLFLEMASKLSKGPGEILDPSFPSAHADFSFMMATLLAAWFPRYWIIFFIIGIVAGKALGWIGGLVFGGASPYAQFMGITALSSIAQMLIQPLTIIAVVMIYYDLRIRKEGFDLEMLSKALGVGVPMQAVPVAGPPVQPVSPADQQPPRGPTF